MATKEDGRSIFREQRAAQNESLFRSINERIEPLNEAFSIINRINDFVCECPDKTCTKTIGMSVDEYEAIRAEGNRFVVAPGDEHVWPDVEAIIDKRDRYWVVEKFGYSGKLAAHHDPRAQEAPRGPNLRLVE
jgi:hypothetical protein